LDGPFIPVLGRSLALLSAYVVDRVDRDKLLPSPPPDLIIAAAELLLGILSPFIIIVISLLFYLLNYSSSNICYEFWCIGSFDLSV